MSFSQLYCCRPILFEDVITILVSIFVLLREKRKERVSVRLRWMKGEKGKEAFDPNKWSRTTWWRLRLIKKVPAIKNDHKTVCLWVKVHFGRVKNIVYRSYPVHKFSKIYFSYFIKSTFCKINFHHNTRPHLHNKIILILADFETIKSTNFKIYGKIFVSRSAEIQILLGKWGVAMKVFLYFFFDIQKVTIKHI